MAAYRFEDPKRVGEVGSARLNKYSVQSFSAMLTHEPCDRHAYGACWVRDLEQKPTNSNILRLAEFLRRYQVPMFEGDKSFLILNHQFLMLGSKTKSSSTLQEHLPLCMCSLESLVSPAFIETMEAWLEETKPKLNKWAEDFSDSTTQHRMVGMATHSEMVELEVSHDMVY